MPRNKAAEKNAKKKAAGKKAAGKKTAGKKTAGKKAAKKNAKKKSAGKKTAGKKDGAKEVPARKGLTAAERAQRVEAGKARGRQRRLSAEAAAAVDILTPAAKTQELAELRDQVDERVAHRMEPYQPLHVASWTEARTKEQTRGIMIDNETKAIELSIRKGRVYEREDVVRFIERYSDVVHDVLDEMVGVYREVAGIPAAAKAELRRLLKERAEAGKDRVGQVT